MLPRDSAKTTITLYNFIPEQQSFKRTVLPDCIWAQDSSSIHKKQGTATPEDVIVQIPYDYDYFSVTDGQAFSGDGWTLQMGPELHATYIVRGECPFLTPPKIDPSTPPSGKSWFVLTLDTMPITDDEFVRGVILPFEDKYHTKRTREVSEVFYGSRSLWYVEAKC